MTNSDYAVLGPNTSLERARSASSAKLKRRRARRSASPLGDMKASTAILAAIAWLQIVGCTEERPQEEAPKLPSAPAEREALSVPWKFTIQDLQHRAIGSLTVRFTGDEAESCMSGDWKRVEVADFESSGEPGFPGREPLAYLIVEDNLIIGRNEICDAYVMLQGELKPNGLAGDYFSLGLEGRRNRGYVEARPLAVDMSPNTSLERTREK